MPIEIDSDTETKTRLQLLEILDTLQREHKVGARVTASLKRALPAAALPLTSSQCEGWLRALCRHADGSDYAKSQRAVFVRDLNCVFSAWHGAGLTAELFQVRNYRRYRQYGLLNVEALQYVTLSQVDTLKAQFLRQLCDPKILQDKADRLQVAFHHFVFAAIAFGGMAWTGVFADLARLQWRHLRTASQGYVLIPRFGVEHRIHVPPLVSFCALLVGEHLPHPPKTREPDPVQPILPGVTIRQWMRIDAGKHEDEEEENYAKDFPAVAAARAKFNAWLGNLCVCAGLRDATGHPIKILVQALADVSRAYVVEIYSPPVAGALLGLIPYSPVPEEQSRIFEDYRRTDNPLQNGEKSEIVKSIALQGTPNHPATSDISGEDDDLTSAIVRLHRAFHPLFGKSGPARKKAAQQLEELADVLLSEIGFDGETAPAKVQGGYGSHLAQDGGTTRQVAHFNVACLTLWLADLCRNSKLDPKTIAARRSDALLILRLFPERCLNELDEEDAYELVRVDRAESSRRRVIGTLHQLHSFLETQLGLPVPAMDWREFAVTRTQQRVNLIGQAGFERLQQALRDAEARAQNEDASDKAHAYRIAYFAANLAFYFGARLNETVQLTVSDLVIRSQQPYLCIWRSKRGKSRTIYARHVPDEILEELKRERGRRYALTKDLAASFLANDRGEMADPKRISELVVEILQELGLRGNEDAMPVVFHTLRHEYANRLMIFGVPLLDLANSMGHASPDTTTGSYLHCFDFLQREQLETYLMHAGHETGLAYNAIGARLGIGRTAVLALLSRYEKATGESVTYFKRGEADKESRKTERIDQHRIPCGEAVKSVAYRLGVSGLVSKGSQGR